MFKVEEAFAKFDASGDNQLDYKVPFTSTVVFKIILIKINITVITISGILPDDPQETGGKVKKKLKTIMMVFIKSYF